MVDFQIIIPVLNEVDSIEELVARIDKALRASDIKYSLIFVDDHSTDGTQKVIRSLKGTYPIKLHVKKGKRGKAYSVLEGARIATARTLAMIDGDLQYPPEALPEMYLLAREHGVVVANRNKSELSTIRRLGSKLAARLVGGLLLGLACDTQSGLKVFKKEIIDNISVAEVKPWALDMPLLHAAVEMGHSIGCVEIQFAARNNGKSKVAFLATAYEIISTALNLKLRQSKAYSVGTGGANGCPIGRGVVHRRKRYITHTTLPHEHSALQTFSRAQKYIIAAAISLLILGMYLNIWLTVISFVAVLTLVYFADVIFGMYVLNKSLHFPPELKISCKELDGIDERELPVYTILCPLYKESAVLPHFVKAIQKLDWPKAKLDVKLLLEEDDRETIEAAEALQLPEYVEVLVVPDSQPKTKPKACNFGLAHAKGEYVVIYDAEDKPEPDQLKKAYLAFQKVDKKTICLQSKLNYYNPEHNFLTRLFTAEYSLWFDVVLPGLQSIETHIPLGGTSNHFRKRDLVGVHAWDPFNVTEDCDLGVRLFKEGYKTAIIDSTTYEEANSSVKNWVRQRSRWIKGYFQTYLVHTRNPLKFIKANGIHSLLFHLVIGMRMSFMLINPFLWLSTASYFLFRDKIGYIIESVYPAAVFYMAAVAFVVGNFMYIYSYMIGAVKRGHYSLVKYVFLVPFYWMLTSIAAFIALYQLLVKPHFWEKTHHGLHLPTQKKGKKYFSNLSLGLSPSGPLPVSIPGFAKRLLSDAQFSGGALLVAAAVLANFMNFLTSAYLGRALSAEEFGLISLMISFLFIVQIPAGSIGTTISHLTAFLYGKSGRTPSSIWEKYKVRFVSISLVLTLLWVLLIPTLTGFFNSHTIIPFVVFAPMWVILLLGAVSGGFLNGNQKFHLLAILITIESVAKLIISIIFVELGFGSWVYATLPLSLAIGLVVSLYFAGRLSAQSKATEKTGEIVFPKKFFVTSMLVGLTSVSFLSLDLVFVKHFLSAVAAGQYALLVLVGRMVYMVGALFSQFILPVVSRDLGAKKNSWKKFNMLLAAVILSTSAMFVFVGPLGSYTVPVLFGDKALSILPYLSPFAFSMILFSVAHSMVIFHLARKEYSFSLPGILTVFVMALGLYYFHGGIDQVVQVMLASGVFYLSFALSMHVFYKRLLVPEANVKDLFGLFMLKLNGKKQLPVGALRILVYNWRDIRHVWAGGAEVYVHELAMRWAKEGHKVTIFCGNDGSNLRNEEINGVKIIRRGGFYTVYLWAFLYYLVHFRRKYDLIVESENGVPFFTPLYSTKPKILVVHHIHQEVFRNHLNFPLSSIARFVEQVLMPIVYRGKTVVAVSSSTKNEVVKKGISRDEHVHIVSPGVDTALYHKSRKAQYPLFIYLGRHKAYKNIDVAIKAFAKVLKVHPNAIFTIAGEGECTESLKRLTVELGIRRSVYFTGKVSEEEKVRLLGRAWAAIQPSSFEGWGITVIEANACGTPVIASKVNGLTDSVIDGKTGLLVPVKDVNSLAKAMVGIIEDEAFRKSLSEEAYKWAQNHDWQTKAESFMDVINGIVKKKGAHVYTGDLSPSASYSYEEK